MAVTDNVIEILKRWDRFKRIDETPERVDALERRIAQLERQLQRAPGEACPRCGVLDFRAERAEPHPTLAATGARLHHMKCGACGFEDQITK